MSFLLKKLFLAQTQPYLRATASIIISSRRGYATHIVTPENCSIKCYTNNNVSYATTSTDFHLIPDTIGDRIRVMAQLYPLHKAFHFPHNRGLSLTYSELKQRVDSMSQNLLELGFQRGDRLAIVLPNTHETLLTFMAAAQIGVISVILSPAYQLVELEFMLKKTGAKGLVIYDTFRVLKHLEIMRKICPELEKCEPGELNSARLPDLKHVFVLNSPLVSEKKIYDGTWSFDQLSENRSSLKKKEYPIVEMDDPCLILFTSGTTGKPKGATLSHFGLINSGLMASFMTGKDAGNSNICSPIPLFHIFGFVSGLIVPLLIEDSKAVFPFYFPDTSATMKTIHEHKCVSLRGPPITYIDILNHPDRSKFDLSSLKNVVFGGSTVPPDLLIRLKKELNVKDIIVGYGMTETTMCQTTTNISDALKSYKHAFESVGRPVPFTEVKIVDPETGKIQPLNTDGELCLRGFNIMKGYWDEPELTAKVLDKNGWLRTGDILSMDSEGYLYFKSRSKDVIIRGGANIYPAEVEAFLRTNTKISEVHVFGVPDKRLTEEVCAWVKLKPNEAMSEQELKTFCKGNISQFKIPRYIKFVNSFPVNINGKVQLNVMEEMSKQEFKL